MNNSFTLYSGPGNGRLPPKARVVGVEVGGRARAYPWEDVRRQRLIEDRVGDVNVVVMHMDGTVSATDRTEIAASEDIGTTGVYRRTLAGKTLDFEIREEKIVDTQTGSTWDISGRAVAGDLMGKELPRVEYGDYFAFAWWAFKPGSTVYGSDSDE